MNRRILSEYSDGQVGSEHEVCWMDELSREDELCREGEGWMRSVNGGWMMMCEGGWI